jgi:hypothetical protein
MNNQESRTALCGVKDGNEFKVAEYEVLQIIE